MSERLQETEICVRCFQREALGTDIAEVILLEELSDDEWDRHEWGFIPPEGPTLDGPPCPLWPLTREQIAYEDKLLALFTPYALRIFGNDPDIALVTSR